MCFQMQSFFCRIWAEMPIFARFCGRTREFVGFCFVCACTAIDGREPRHAAEMSILARVSHLKHDFKKKGGLFGRITPEMSIFARFLSVLHYSLQYDTV